MSPPSPRLTVRFHRLMWLPVRGFIFFTGDNLRGFHPSGGVRGKPFRRDRFEPDISSRLVSLMGGRIRVESGAAFISRPRFQVAEALRVTASAPSAVEPNLPERPGSSVANSAG